MYSGDETYSDDVTSGRTNEERLADWIAERRALLDDLARNDLANVTITTDARGNVTAIEDSDA